MEIGKKSIGVGCDCYFIADLGANHDGDFGRALELIELAADAGADAAKFQHFSAQTIVSDRGFQNLGKQLAHQAAWDKSVFEVYQAASIDMTWTSKLKEHCDKCGIEFLTSPYDIDIVNEVDPFLSAFKIGSGDLTWLEILEHIASKGKPVLLATGASSLDEVIEAVEAIEAINSQLVLMQCNTNYTGSLENFKYCNLNVLNLFSKTFPGRVLGFSDHTPGHSAVLGAIALGAKVIEKHFTDSNERNGPDHKFAMNPVAWRDMIDRARELELALGDGTKKIEANEEESVIVQRRSLRYKYDLPAGHRISKHDLSSLRPCPKDAMSPREVEMVIGKILVVDKLAGDHVRECDIK
jgi:sialic acid synthase SpsE